MMANLVRIFLHFVISCLFSRRPRIQSCGNNEQARGWTCRPSEPLKGRYMEFRRCVHEISIRIILEGDPTGFMWSIDVSSEDEPQSLSKNEQMTHGSRLMDGQYKCGINGNNLSQEILQPSRTCPHEDLSVSVSRRTTASSDVANSLS